MNKPLNTARRFLKRGWKPVPVPYGKKAPRLSDWQNVAINSKNVARYFNGKAQNIAVQMGPQSAGLCDIDLDSAEAVQLASHFLPSTKCSFGRKSKPESHRLYVLNDPDRSTVLQYKDECGGMIVEIRIGADGGALSVLPGSMHEDGEPIIWVSNGKPPVVPFAILKNAVRNLAVASLLLKHWPSDGTHELSLCVGGFLARAGLDAPDIEHIIKIVSILSGMSGKKAKDNARTAGNAAHGHAEGENSYGLPQLKKLMNEKVATVLAKTVEYGDGQSFKKMGFTLGDNGKPVNSQGNIKVALQLLGVSLKHDAFQDRSIVCGLQGFDALDDRAVDRLWLLIDEKYQFRPTKEFFWTVLCDEARRNSFHPVCDYLNSLKWDGVKRLEKLLITYGGAEDTKFNCVVGKLSLIAAVRRVRQPGCKFDEMLVLESAQGLEKSSALAILAVNPDWFTDDLPLGADSKTAIERMKGRWIIEAAELKGMRKAEIEHLKSFLSRQTDRARMSYDRATSELKRQCVIFGTTNSHEFLQDQTGNRRYWPVRIGAFDLVKLRNDRDQLWAEAAALESQGLSIRLPREMWSHAAVEQTKRTVDDPWIEVVERGSSDVNGKLLAVDAWKMFDVPESQRTQFLNERLGNAMRGCGWNREKARFGQKTKWAYVRGPKPYAELVVSHTKEIVIKSLAEQSRKINRLISRSASC